MAITKQGIPAVVTIIMLNSLLYANFITITAYAQMSFEGEQLQKSYENLQEQERKQAEIEETVRNGSFFDAEDREESAVMGATTSRFNKRGSDGLKRNSGGSK